MDDAAKALWNYSIEEITAGHAEEEEAYRCVFCGRALKRGKFFRKKAVCMMRSARFGRM